MELQTEYEWKIDRLRTLKYHAGFGAKCNREIEELCDWLNNNPQECWERCTKENTKVGDFVQPIPEMIPGAVPHPREVTYILDNKDEEFVLLYPNGQENLKVMRNYEINTNKGAE